MNPLQTIPNLPPAISLDGSEQVWINQSGVDRRTTAASLAQAAALSGYLPTSGGTVTGDLTVLGVFTGGGHIYAATPPLGDNSTKVATTEWVNEAVAADYLPLTGGTITGNLDIDGSNTIGGFGYALTPLAGDDSTKLATTAFVKAAIAAGGGGGGPTYLPLTGGTLTGPLGINAPGSSYFTLNDAAGNLRSVTYETASLNRWSVLTDNSAEGGSNAGSNFNIVRYSDAGTSLGAAININRATGLVTIPASLAIMGAGTGTTPAPGDNSTALATTAFVNTAIAAGSPPGSNTLPLMDGTAAAGTATAWSRGDHVHPSDTSRAAASALANYLPLAGGTMSGNLTVTGITTLNGVSTAPTPAAADSSTNIATTAFVHSVVGSGAFLPLSGGTLTGNLNGPSATFTNSLTGGNLGSNGTLTVTGNSALNGTVSTGNLTSNNITSINNLNCKDWVVCNDAPGTWRGLQMQSNGAARWLLIANSAAETGGSAGSDFVIMNYSDSGSGTNALSISRANGNAVFSGSITANPGINTSGQLNAGNLATQGSNAGVGLFARNGATEYYQIYNPDGGGVHFWDSGSGDICVMTAGRMTYYNGITCCYAPQLRALSSNGASGYGALFHNDGSSTYILLTNQNDALGTWNGLRPFSINNSNGSVSIGNNLHVSGGISCDSGGVYSNGYFSTGSFPPMGNYYPVIGYYIGGSMYNMERLGIVTAGTQMTLYYNNGGNIGYINTTASDRRKKSNIKPAGDAIDIVKRIPIYDLDYNAGIKSTVSEMADSETEHWPFSMIADEVAAVMPRAAMKGVDKDADYWVSLNTQHLVSTLWKAVQQLTERLEAVEGKVAA